MQTMDRALSVCCGKVCWTQSLDAGQECLVGLVMHT